MVFRDEHGNPLAVFDVESGEWLAPEQAGVDFPLEIATEARADDDVIVMVNRLRVHAQIIILTDD